AEELLHYEPYIANIANAIATELQRRDVQSQLQRVMRDLENQVADRTAALVQQNAALEQEIDSRKRLEEELRRSEERYRSLVIATTQIVWTTNACGQVVGDMPAWRAFTGQAAEEIQGQGWCNALHPEDRQPTLAVWTRAVAQRAIYDTSYRLRRHDGSYRYVAVRGVPVLEVDGTVREWVGTCTDITERKKAEDALLQAHDELEMRVQRRTAELADVNEHLLEEIAEREHAEQALKEANYRKDEFLAMLAHELRNPLAPIRNATELLKLQPAPRHPHVQQAQDVIDRQLHHLTRLVDDLLDVARINSGRIQLKKATVDLADIVKQAVETVRPLIDERRHELTVELPQEALSLEADPVRLKQVLENLLHNAAKYTERGGRIALRIEKCGDEAVMTVEDNGIGIPAEVLRRVFDLFVQADRSLGLAQGGLGLGLTLVRRLVEMHGGSVEAVSDGIGKGSRFIVRQPLLANASREVAPPPSSSAAASCPRRRILVADDNVDVANSLALLLRTLGHDVRIANTGQEALAAVETYGPDFVLLDIGLPDMSGLEVARTLRSQYPSDRLSLIAVSGYGQEEDRRRAEQAGFDHYFLKPMDLKEIRRLLAR
ncbi:MAG: chemotaxis protein methyltransferase CheR, partial [Proteobacteria bacterium]|nr:chemotaxis protein methyltransferase CheR [Pseudomonadota bacterium]